MGERTHLLAGLFALALAACSFDPSQGFGGTSTTDGGEGVADAAILPLDAAYPAADARRADARPDAAGSQDAAMTDGWLLIETLSLPGTGETVMTMPLLVGVSYRTRVSGDIMVATGWRADAEWYWHEDAPGTVYDTYFGTDLGVSVDGVDADWGPLALDHSYQLEWVGAGSPLSLRYRDDNYSNNSGTLQVEIHQRLP